MGFLMLVVVLAFFATAYLTYGRFIARKVFKLNDANVTPSHELEDGVDYVPTRKEIVLGHHFTSIAGLGPIVGPAIGVIWGWLPAILWITLGTVFAGAVHDFSALVMSLRNKAVSIGELTTQIIGSRARWLFFAIIFFELWIVIAIFALIVGILFNMYPKSVFAVWMEIPIAIGLSYMVFKRGKGLGYWSWWALLAMYAMIPISLYLPAKFHTSPAVTSHIWISILMVYSFIAASLPVRWLLQPRDYINAHELIVVMVLLGLGAIVALFKSPTHMALVGPVLNLHPKGAPPLWPFLFVTIACGAISGFHSLVSSGTSSKQADKETDAQTIGYGGMILEGILATLAVMAVAAGIGAASGSFAAGAHVWHTHYATWSGAAGLGSKIGAIVTGSVNILGYMIGHGGWVTSFLTVIMAVFIVSFAATTLDTATRVQRYVFQEVGRGIRWNWLTNKYVATGAAVVTAWLLCLARPGGKGALALWPIFGTVNQLLAGLALLVATIYLVRKGYHWVFAAIPMVFMIIMTGWAMWLNIDKFIRAHDTLLIVVAIVIFALMVWLIVEAFNLLRRRKEIAKIELK